MAVEEVNWHNYFETIKNVCPWSWASWQKNKIDIISWHSQIINLNYYEARVYIAARHNPRQLKKMSDRFNRERPNEEWLWSHPDYGFNSTPVAVFIQQDRQILDDLRRNLNKKKINA